MPGSRSSSALTMLLLPPPEGAATTKRQPEAPGLWVVIVIGGPYTLAASLPPEGAQFAAWGGPALLMALPPSFQILHLLAHLLDQHLELQRHLRQFRVDRLR